MIRIEKTVYDEPDPSDGKRILVMRLWPRGVSKEKIDLWLKELGTPTDLIKKWKNGSVTWSKFSEEYIRSLDGKDELLKDLATQARQGTITLLCSCKDVNHCHRYLLREVLMKSAQTNQKPKVSS